MQEQVGDTVVTRRSWWPMLLKCAFGILLIACGVLLYQAFVDRADQRIAHGAIVTGQVTGVGTTRGIDSVSVTYTYKGWEYHATARSLLGSADDYRDTTEIEIYIDPNDLASIALPGGFASDGNWVLVSLPIPLVVWGSAAVVLAVVRRLRPDPETQNRAGSAGEDAEQ